MIETRPLPVGPPISLQLAMLAVAPARASFAAAGSKGALAASFAVVSFGADSFGVASLSEDDGSFAVDDDSLVLLEDCFEEDD